MTALAEFHLAVADFSPALPFSRGIPSAIVTRLARLHDLQAGGVAKLATAIHDSTWQEFAQLARRFINSLPRALPSVIARLSPLASTSLPQQPCIRDIWRDHVLFDGQRVTGIVDFGAMQIDTPACDVARLLGSFVGDDVGGWREGLAAYTRIRPLSPAELLAVPALDHASTVLAGYNWIRWIYVDRREFDDPARIVTRLAQLLDRLNRIETAAVD
jgi:homoserine kinase type II